MKKEFFTILRLHRDDIKQAFEGNDKYGTFDTESLTDEEMKDIASNIADVFMESGTYWEAAFSIASEVVDERKEAA